MAHTSSECSCACLMLSWHGCRVGFCAKVWAHGTLLHRCTTPKIGWDEHLPQACRACACAGGPPEAAVRRLGTLLSLWQLGCQPKMVGLPEISLLKAALYEHVQLATTAAWLRLRAPAGIWYHSCSAIPQMI